MTISLTGYEAAHTGTALYRVPEAGYLRIGGADRADFIQRQTTNDVKQLAPDRAPMTVLTTPKARILDVWRLIPEADAVGVVTLPGRGAATARYLQKRIFFMDKVTVTDASAEIAQIELWGPRAAALLRQVGIDVPPEPDALESVSAGASVLRVIRRAGGGYVLLVPAAGADTLAAWLYKAGAAPVSNGAYDVLRVEAGRPAVGRELSEDYTPLETNLDAAISDSKGCYTGQEVIARQVNYDKITRRLVGLRLDRPAAVGAAVFSDEGRTIGAITSAVHSPQYGPVALAVIKRPHHAPGTAVTVQNGETEPIPAQVSDLPFVE